VEAVLTIGVYGWDEARFLTALRSARVDEVWDVRDRRGVRGRDGAWANATHLEEALRRADIGYRHRRELAPPTELRKRLQEDDRDHRRRHRDRTELPSWFVGDYRAQVLHELDLTTLATETVARRPALLCVEGPASACHRSLAASELAEVAGIEVESLMP
jgi:uncharacterized protein (DUF488 family)